jgi:hypothetical protein
MLPVEGATGAVPTPGKMVRWVVDGDTKDTATSAGNQLATCSMMAHLLGKKTRLAVFS